jgi:hypothetical protein
MPQTSDISIAAYFITRGVKLSGIRLNPNPRASIDCTFVFEDGCDFDALVMEYTSSVEAAFDGALRSLRKACSEMRLRENQLRDASRARGQSVTGRR